MSTIERFLKKIKILDNGCWEWVASKNPNGYGQFGANGTHPISSHRFIYEYYHGSICPDLTIDHLCRNRACVNVNHLEQVTMKVNVLRGNTITAINSRKTHCIHGHEFTPENTYIRKEGKRNCKACTLESCRRQRKRKLIEVI